MSVWCVGVQGYQERDPSPFVPPARTPVPAGAVICPVNRVSAAHWIQHINLQWYARNTWSRKSIAFIFWLALIALCASLRWCASTCGLFSGNSKNALKLASYKHSMEIFSKERYNLSRQILDLELHSVLSFTKSLPSVHLGLGHCRKRSQAEDPFLHTWRMVVALMTTYSIRGWTVRLPTYIPRPPVWKGNLSFKKRTKDILGINELNAHMHGTWVKCRRCIKA